MPFVPQLSAEDVRLLANLRSSAHTLRLIKNTPNRLTKSGEMLWDGYDDRFIAAFDTADSLAGDSGPVRDQVEALRDLFNEIKSTRK